MTLRRLIAAAQGGSYLYFGLWSLLRRNHYREVHALESDDWVLNAHGGWLSVVGATLLSSAVSAAGPGRETELLGFSSAAALAANDAALARHSPRIYRSDLVYELALAAAWAAARRGR